MMSHECISHAATITPKITPADLGFSKPGSAYSLRLPKSSIYPLVILPVRCISLLNQGKGLLWDAEHLRNL